MGSSVPVLLIDRPVATVPMLSGTAPPETPSSSHPAPGNIQNCLKSWRGSRVTEGQGEGRSALGGQLDVPRATIQGPGWDALGPHPK